MKKKQRVLLASDATINVVLGLLLLLFPAGLLDFFGLPPATTYFYPTILGGVLFGIGVALGIELFFYPGVRGLGLAGAIAINFSGGLVLLYWLLFSNLDIPVRGTILLWVVVILVLGIGLMEVATKSYRMD